ncbi:hypothetical protein ACVMYR_08465 [Micromonospora sp. PTRAS2]
MREMQACEVDVVAFAAVGSVGQGGEGGLYIRFGFGREGRAGVDRGVFVVRGAGDSLADERHEDFDDVGVVVGRVPEHVFECMDAADAYVQFVGSEPFEGLGEPVGDLPAVSEAVVAGGVEQTGKHHHGATE